MKFLRVFIVFLYSQEPKIYTVVHESWVEKFCTVVILNAYFLSLTASWLAKPSDLWMVALA